MLPQRSDRLLEDLTGKERVHPGLEELKSFKAREISILQSRCKIAIIGGTNGKGQVSLALRDACIDHGARVATWISPHLLSVVERVQIGDELVSDDELSKAIESNWSASQALGIPLSFYELLFCSFIDIAIACEADTLVLEVGLGGRLDAVNVFDADVMAITSIGRDHQAWLGGRLDGILKEKLGIARQGRPLVFAPSSQYLRDVCNRNCVGEVEFLDSSASYQHQNEQCSARMSQLLLGRRYQESGRYGVRSNVYSTPLGHQLLLNSAHNPQGMRAFLETVPSAALLAIGLSDREERDIKAILNMAIAWRRRRGGNVVLVNFEHYRCAPADKLLRNSLQMDLQLVDLADLLPIVNPGDLVALCGSNYFLSCVLRHFQLVQSPSDLYRRSGAVL